MREYYVLTLDPRIGQVFEFIDYHRLDFEVHLNRTRFWLKEPSQITELELRFSDCCHWVDPQLDLATGLPLGPL